jgi:hypothetical protein
MGGHFCRNRAKTLKGSKDSSEKLASAGGLKPNETFSKLNGRSMPESSQDVKYTQNLTENEQNVQRN